MKVFTQLGMALFSALMMNAAAAVLYFREGITGSAILILWTAGWLTGLAFMGWVAERRREQDRMRWCVQRAAQPWRNAGPN